jgi:hypothetical protein
MNKQKNMIMKKLFIFAFVILHFTSVKAQDFDQQFKRFSDQKQRLSNVDDSTYVSVKDSLMEQIMRCLDLVENEEQYILLYNETGVFNLNSKDYDRQQLCKILAAKSELYEERLLVHNFHKQAIDFFSKNVPSVSVKYDPEEKDYVSVLHFKKKLSNYTSAELFWLFEISKGIFECDTLDATKKEKRLALEKIEKSSLKGDYYSDFFSDLNDE